VNHETKETVSNDIANIEQVAAKVHEAWIESKRFKGVTSRLSETGEEIDGPYDQLSESAKDLDRGASRRFTRLSKRAHEL